MGKKIAAVMKTVLFLCLLFMASLFHTYLIKEIKEQGETVVEPAIVLEKQEKKVEKYAYLTFDDGPSDNTDKILDILNEKGVKATFFVVGKEGETAKERYRRIIEEGHSLGMHSYSHDYSVIYSSLNAFQEDVIKLQEYLYEVTGEIIQIYRFPGGSSNSVANVSMMECIEFLNKKGIVYFDWNASSEDAVTVNADCNQLNDNVLKDALRFHNAVILMHDLHECKETVAGLEQLIDRLKAEGYEFKILTEETKPVQHVKSDTKNLATMGNK